VTVPSSAATTPMMIAMLRGASQNPCLVFSNRSAFITATLSSSSDQIAHAAVRCRWFCTYSRSAISICFVRDRPSARAMTASSALKSAGRRSVKDASDGGLLAAVFFRVADAKVTYLEGHSCSTVRRAAASAGPTQNADAAVPGRPRRFPAPTDWPAPVSSLQ